MLILYVGRWYEGGGRGGGLWWWGLGREGERRGRRDETAVFFSRVAAALLSRSLKPPGFLACSCEERGGLSS